MKIAILTLPLHTNYGGILQAYALQTFLQRRGHKVVVVNREHYWNGGNKLTIQNFFFRIGSFIKSLIRIYIYQYDGYVLRNPFSPYYHTERTIIDPLPFVKEHICQSSEIRSSEKLKKYFRRQKFDAYVVGSDQVWRPCYSPCITDYFLKEVPLNAKSIKISYAASFGSDVWEFSSEETKICSALLKKFHAISVRERSGVRLCQDYLEMEAIHLLDPTLLLDAEDYLNLVQKGNVSPSPGNVFCYILDENPEFNKIVQDVKEQGYTPFYAGLDPTRYHMSVEQWLKSFYDAELIITDSFHACVFSIIFEKPFFVIRNKQRGSSRIESLLKDFCLDDCLIDSYEEYQLRQAPVPYDMIRGKVRSKLKEMRTKSLDFFRSSGLI